MAVTKTKLEIYLEEQINKYKGICMLLRTIRGQEEYEQFDLLEKAADWSREVITILETIEKGREDE